MTVPASATGITVLICTYNGAALLPPTLKHLAAQQMPPDLKWEILVISNASTDNTLLAVPELWAELGSPAPLRVLNEPRPGKHYALFSGFDKSFFEYICVVDDDNWLSPDYLRLAWEIMAANPQIGALGGILEAVYEITPPSWFAEYAGYYAITLAAPQSGDITLTHGFLSGAGCVIRQVAWQRVKAADFETLLVKYPGGRISGEDAEECYAMRLAGYRMWFDERLHLQHFVSAKKLEWKYLYNLYRGNAGATVDLAPYHHYLTHSDDVKAFVWLRDGIYTIRYIIKYKWRAIRSGHWRSAVNTVGNRDVLNAVYYWWVFGHYIRKQLKQDKGFKWVKNFITRLDALPPENQSPLPLYSSAKVH